VLIAFTDGITEAADTEGRELREEGVLEVVRRHPDARACDLVDAIMETAGRFGGSVPCGDDQTVVVVRATQRRESPVFEEHAAEAVLSAAA
jgi:serine phosphatase RsbU (regulator of sigma subunit)